MYVGRSHCRQIPPKVLKAIRDRLSKIRTKTANLTKGVRPCTRRVGRRGVPDDVARWIVAARC
jgi:hypothetical protein